MPCGTEKSPEEGVFVSPLSQTLSVCQTGPPRIGGELGATTHLSFLSFFPPYTSGKFVSPGLDFQVFGP